MFGQEFSYSEWVPFVIAVFTLLGFVLQVVSYAKYSREITYTERLKSRIADLLAVERPDLLPAEELLDSEQIPLGAMVATRTRELEKFAQYPGMVALHDLGAVAAEADAGSIKNSVPNVMIASLLVCGLFGTLLSLSETLQAPELVQFITKDGNASSSVFQESLGSVITGFGKAFNASIYGVGGTIFLIFVRVFVRSRRETCFERLENFVVESLLPYYIEPEKTQLQRASSTVNEANMRFRSVSNQMEKSAEVVNAAVAGLEVAIKDASKTFGEKGAVAYQLVRFTEQAVVLNDSIGKTADLNAGVTKMLEALSADHRNLVNKLDERIESSEQRRQQLMEQLPKFINCISEENQRVKEDFGKSVKELIVAQKDAAAILEDHTKRQHEHVDSLITAIGNDQGTFMQKLHESYLKVTQQTMRVNESVIAENEKISGAVLANLQLLLNQLEKVALREDRVDIDAFNEFRGQLGAVQFALEKVIVANSQAIEKSQDVHRKLDEKMINSFEDFSGRVSTLAKVIDKIAEAGSIENENIKDKIFNIFKR